MQCIQCVGDNAIHTEMQCIQCVGDNAIHTEMQCIQCVGDKCLMRPAIHVWCRQFTHGQENVIEKMTWPFSHQQPASGIHNLLLDGINAYMNMEDVDK